MNHINANKTNQLKPPYVDNREKKASYAVEQKIKTVKLEQFPTVGSTQCGKEKKDK